MIDETDAPLLLAVIVACAVAMRPAVPDMLRYAAASAALGAAAHAAHAAIAGTTRLVAPLRGVRRAAATVWRFMRGIAT